MSSPLHRTIRRVPALHRALQTGKARVHQATVHRVEKMVSQAKHYEILVVFGMRRSGNHVAINWILNQNPGLAVFYNNIRPENPPFSGRMTEFRLRNRGRLPRIVLSYEDVSIAELQWPQLRAFLEDRQSRHGAAVRFVVMLRDPYNLFASRLRKWPERFATPEDRAEQRALYLEHARLALNPAPIWRDAPVVPLLYNDLIGDPAARDQIADALDIRRGTRGLDDVPVYGHGSSFDGMEISGAGVRDQVFMRWQSLASDPLFEDMIRDPDIVSMGGQLFDMAPFSAPD